MSQANRRREVKPMMMMLLMMMMNHSAHHKLTTDGLDAVFNDSRRCSTEVWSTKYRPSLLGLAHDCPPDFFRTRPKLASAANM